MVQDFVLEFVRQINAHDVNGIVARMTEDHTFVDAYGSEITGKEKIKAGWSVYFQWFPDYNIEIHHMLESNSLVLAFGFASGTFKNLRDENNSNYWRLPAAWKILIEDGKIKLWQVCADTKIPFDIIHKNN